MKNYLGVTLVVLFVFLIHDFSFAQCNLENCTPTPETCIGDADGTVTADCTDCTAYRLDGIGSWQTSPIFINLSPGFYFIQGAIDENDPSTYCQCIDVEVVAGSMPDISCDANPESCDGSNDGSVSVLVNEQNPPYSYAWNDPNNSTTSMVSNLSPGIYTVTVMDINGCTDSCEVEIDEGPDPVTPAFSFAVEFCNGDNVPDLPDLSDNGVMGNWSPSSIDNSQSITYTFTPDSGECAEEVDVDIEIHDNPVPQITGSSTFCSGGSTTLTADAGFSNYMWSNGSTSASISVTMAGTYSVTVTDNNSCTGTSSVMVTESSSLMPTISGDLSFCSGQNTTISASSDFVSYAWSSGQTNATIVVSSAGTYTVTVSDGSGCTGTASVAIVENPSPTITFSGIANICQSSPPFNLIASPPGGTFAGSGVVGGVTFNPAVANVGMNLISYAYTDANGCSASSIASFNVIQTPVSQISPSSTSAVCEGGTISLNASQSGTGLTYNWTGPNNFSSTLKSPVISNATNLNQGLYTLIVTDTNTTCEYRAATINVTVYMRITGTISASSISCNGGTTTITSNPSDGSGSYGYLWNINNQTTQSINGGAGSYSVTISDLSGVCPDVIVNENVSQPQELVSNVSVTGESCAGAEDGFISFTNSGGTILNPQDPYTTTLSNNSTSSAVSGNFPDLRDGIYTLTVRDANGCTDSEVLTVTEGTSVNISISGAQANLCDEASPLTLNANGNAFNYSWQINNSNGGNSSTLTIGDNEGPGVYSVILAGMTNSENQPNKVCSSVSPLTTINIWDNPSPLISIPSEICQEAVGTVSVATINDSDINDSHTYSWNTFQTSPSIGIATSLGSQNQNYSVTVTDNHGCSGSSSGSVYVNAKPSVDFNFVSIDTDDNPTVDILFDIDGSAIEMEDNSSIVSTSWCFDPPISQLNGPMGISELQGSDFVNLFTSNRGDHTFTYKATDSNGCQSRIEKEFNFRLQDDCNILLVSPVQDQTFCIGDVVDFSFEHVISNPNQVPPIGLGNISYTVTLPNGTSAGIVDAEGSNDLFPEIEFNTSGEDILITAFLQETNGGCTDTFSFSYKVSDRASILSFPTILESELIDVCDSIVKPINITGILPADEELVIFYSLDGAPATSVEVSGGSVSIDLLNDVLPGGINDEETHILEFREIRFKNLDDCGTLLNQSYTFQINNCGCESLEIPDPGIISQDEISICDNDYETFVIKEVFESDDYEQYYVMSLNGSLTNRYDARPIETNSQSIIGVDTDSTVIMKSAIESLLGESFGTVYFYRVFTSKTSDCTRVGTRYILTIRAAPKFELSSNKLEYCLNEPAVIIEPKLENLLEDQNWKMTELSFEGLSFESTRQLDDTTSFYTGLYNSDGFGVGQSYTFSGEVSYFYDGINCAETATIDININNGIAINDPDAFIQWWPGNILACSLNDSIYSWQWGKSLGPTGEAQAVEAMESDNWYYVLSDNESGDIDSDGIPMVIGERMNYWVDVWTNETAEECKLRLYYTGDGFVPRGIDLENQNEFTIYPNPSNGLITLDLPRNHKFITDIYLTDVIGGIRRSIKHEGIEPKLDADLSNLSSGVYLLTLKYLNGNILTKKIIISK